MSKHDRRQFAKAKRPKTKLGLPALDHSKSAVLNSLRSPESKRGYTHAIEEFIASEYSRTGFRGALNWYRGQDIFWQETPFLIGQAAAANVVCRRNGRRRGRVRKALC